MKEPTKPHVPLSRTAHTSTLGRSSLNQTGGERSIRKTNETAVQRDKSCVRRVRLRRRLKGEREQEKLARRWGR
jgi:hypothetical protein